MTRINTYKPFRLAAGTQKALDKRLLSFLCEVNSLLSALQTLTWELGITFSQENCILLEPSTEAMLKTEQLLAFLPLLREHLAIRKTDATEHQHVLKHCLGEDTLFQWWRPWARSQGRQTATLAHLPRRPTHTWTGRSQWWWHLRSNRKRYFLYTELFTKSWQSADVNRASYGKTGDINTVTMPHSV